MEELYVFFRQCVVAHGLAPPQEVDAGHVFEEGGVEVGEARGQLPAEVLVQHRQHQAGDGAQRQRAVLVRGRLH